ncbi:phospholipid phosphatase 6-like [Pygocentrus nattereri]|uniref:Polyisoprenoid diphosphate/phosphate phosphohydrolase PLPP6 n=1 Tax=Pygocentrus nattereri TaxID=42514 RepID=A0A3B4DX55_PYGNA|nr:phospholipid phosphatase 6-like [Pygocentrus nattereri]
MPSPGARRSSWANGSRCEPGSSSRRRASSCSCPAGGAPSSRRLSQPFAAVALRSLLAVDLWLSRRLGVCAAEDSLLGGIRPLVKLLELSAHRTPWVSSAVYLLLTSRTAEEQELVINLLMALLLDHILVRVIKAFVRYHSSEMFATVPPHPRYSFPSGHVTRAAMCACFLHARLLLDAPVRALLLVWAALMGLSQVLLGQHNVSGVTLALAMGYCQYSLVERCWVPSDWLQDIMLTVLGCSQVTLKD